VAAAARGLRPFGRSVGIGPEGGCGPPNTVAGMLSSIADDAAPRATICSTMLLPSSPKARCATVSPTDERWQRLQPIEFLDCRLHPSHFAKDSSAIRAREGSECVHPALESRKRRQEFVFDVIAHTPPYTFSERFSSKVENGKRFAQTLAEIDNLQQISCGKKPSCEIQPRDVLLAHHRTHHGLEDLHAIGTAQFGFGRSFGMRHHADHIAARTANARDIVQRAVWIGRP